MRFVEGQFVDPKWPQMNKGASECDVTAAAVTSRRRDMALHRINITTIKNISPNSE